MLLGTSVMASGPASAASGFAGWAAPTITAVSNSHPELVSGNDVLVRVTAPDGGSVRVTVNGREISGFTRQRDGSLLGLVTGLRLGDNHIMAMSHGRAGGLNVVNHPNSGSVFSGARQSPYYCETTAFGLAPASPPSCSAPTVVRYRYRTTGGAFAPLANPTARPADLATTRVNGRTVPYVVRLETGTIDRAVYQIAALFDGSAPSPVRPDTSWNDRLIYTFGGGCDGGHQQGNTTGGVIDDLFLSRGYAVASSSLNVLDNNCGTVLSAEAVMMVKEHFIETYGPVAHTIGWGVSGGSIQQYSIANAYPGIIDGIIPGLSFPDPLAILEAGADCGLLTRFFAGAGTSFTAAERQAVTGHLDNDTCDSFSHYFVNRITPADSCNKHIAVADNVIPPADMWNPVTNPDGVKCSALESYVNQFGRDPATGFVRGVLDNVGVQYGLTALRHGQITPAQFVTLNASVGGYDTAGSPVTSRTQADPRALNAAYRDNVLNSAARHRPDHRCPDGHGQRRPAVGHPYHPMVVCHPGPPARRQRSRGQPGDHRVPEHPRPVGGRGRLRTVRDGPVADERRGRSLPAQPAGQGGREQARRPR